MLILWAYLQPCQPLCSMSTCESPSLNHCNDRCNSSTTSAARHILLNAKWSSTTMMLHSLQSTLAILARSLEKVVLDILDYQYIFLPHIWVCITFGRYLLKVSLLNSTALEWILTLEIRSHTVSWISIKTLLGFLSLYSSLMTARRLSMIFREAAKSSFKSPVSNTCLEFSRL